MAAIKTLALTSALLATFAAADGNGQVSLCTSDDCGYCPNSITTQGTGYPACVIYDRETVLGGYADQYPPSNNGIRMIDWSIPPQGNQQCKTIIRSPANTDDENCGYPLYGSTDGGCSALETKTTMMVQFCCGTGDCTAAGVEKRSAGVTSAVFYHEDGTPVMPLAVGYKGVDLMDVFLADMGFNASTILARHEDKLKKRDCDSYAPDGADYTKTGSVSYDVSGYICGDGTMTSITNTQETSETTSFSVSVSDPFGIIMASTSFSFEKSASQSHEYTFTPDAGSCGHVAWTPFYTCTAGTISGCDDGDQHGEACTAKRISDNQVDGVYHFVITD